MGGCLMGKIIIIRDEEITKQVKKLTKEYFRSLGNERLKEIERAFYT